MHFSLVLLGMLPLGSAEACYSIITKTSLVTSVVTTVSFSTFTDSVCLPAATILPVSDSHEKPATSTTISTTIADLPLPTNLETISATAPTFSFSLSTFAQDESDSQLRPTSSAEGTPGTLSSALTRTEPSTEVEGNETVTSSSTSSAEPSINVSVSVTDSESIVIPTPTTSPSFYSNTTTTRPDGVASTPLETLPETTEVPTSTTSCEVSSATTPTTSAEITSTVPSSSADETTIISSTESVDETPDLSSTTTCSETSSTSTPAASPSEEVSETPLTSDCEPSTTTHEEFPTSITATTTTTSSTPALTTSAESTSLTSKEATPTTIESIPSTSDDLISSTSISSTSTSSTSDFSTSTSTLSNESTTTSHFDDETTSSLPSTTTASAPQHTNPPRNGYYPADIVDELRDESIDKLEAHLQENSSGCTLENAKVRREWSDLPVKQREEYIEAVLCLQSLPAKSSSSAPGARSRFDDFLAVHIKQTDYIHGTANFLTWHRYFLFTYEKVLKEECGYAGEHPYWNWDRYAADPASSPLFNGNSSSISGGSTNGGCVASGPFKDMAVNMGPGPSLNYNPRCLKRDMSARWAAQTTVETVYPLITQSNDIARFQDTFQNPGNAHAGGHFTIGGDPGSDIYASAGDPAFYLHHAMVDRVYWLWQLQDLETRLHTVAGQNKQTRQPGALTDLVDLGINGGGVEIGDLLDTMGGLDGELCYIYA